MYFLTVINTFLSGIKIDKTLLIIIYYWNAIQMLESTILYFYII